MNLRIILLILLLSLNVSACGNQSSDDFCLWASPIYLTEKEDIYLKESTIDKILLNNDMYLEQCKK